MARTEAYFIRAGVPTDAAALAMVHVLAFQRAYATLFPSGVLEGLSVEQRTPSWRDRLAIGHGPDYFVLVAESIETGEVAGFATGGGTRDDDRKGAGEVYALYVHPEHWRRGAGASLLTEALHRLTESSFALATLWTLERNMAARAFYARLGWNPDGERRVYTFAGHGLFEIRYEHPTR